MKHIALIATFLFLYGCAFPYPHNNWKTPKFTGVVLSAKTGEPVAGAKVFYESKPELYAITDQNGYYELMPQKEFELFAVILPTAHPIPTMFNLVAVSEAGSAIVETGSCIGDPGFECNGRIREVNFSVQ
ncbi:hypothetical protein [Microbulbifer spongiae]|uniref:Carboxypeptidase-like regulatory domain-containing protein n=1 Tax=Microbulbifer spongiae TaxID=2944933 RepID=A0ABY9E9B1_9GAMM|nr:hypothetical protein [Microbulbifer sp. MI-G]WKD49603.1 carboxypeptidase-like regulatory domain-containing protein [Microbulbifer sp. MI-G]